jgi:hypothetical protein
MKKALILALLITTAAFAVQAGGFGGPMVIGLMPDYDAFNVALDNFNTIYYGGSEGPAFSGPMILIGGQGAGFVQGFSAGGWGGGFFQEATGDSSKAFIGYGMGYGSFGYRFNILDFIWIRPTVELGGGGIGLHIGRYRSSGGFGDPDNGSDNDDYWEDDESYQAGKGFVSVGAAADVTVLIPINKRKTSFAGLNVKGGYLYPVYDSDWFDEHGDIRQVNFTMQGPFLSVGVVFGGKSRNGDYDEYDDYEDQWEEEW